MPEGGMAGSDFIGDIEFAHRGQYNHQNGARTRYADSIYRWVEMKKKVVQPLFEVDVPSCANSLAPAKRPGVTQKGPLTVATFRSWRGSRAFAASDLAFNAAPFTPCNTPTPRSGIQSR
jgi:hypothetical protein